MGKEGVITKEDKEGEEEVDNGGVNEVSGFWFQGSAPDLAFGERGPYGSFGVRSSG